MISLTQTHTHTHTIEMHLWGSCCANLSPARRKIISIQEGSHGNITKARSRFKGPKRFAESPAAVAKRLQDPLQDIFKRHIHLHHVHACLCPLRIGGSLVFSFEEKILNFKRARLGVIYVVPPLAYNVIREKQAALGP